MSDIAARMDATTKPKAPKNIISPSTAYEVPKFEVPKFEMPLVIRELVEKGGAQAKENYEKMNSATEAITGMAKATCATAAEGAKNYRLKIIEMTGANAHAAFDYVGKLMAVKSLSEVIELSTAHAREQFNTVSTQHKELFALAQQVATDSVEPIKMGMSKVFERKA